MEDIDNELTKFQIKFCDIKYDFNVFTNYLSTFISYLRDNKFRSQWFKADNITNFDTLINHLITFLESENGKFKTIIDKILALKTDVLIADIRRKLWKI